MDDEAQDKPEGVIDDDGDTADLSLKELLSHAAREQDADILLLNASMGGDLDNQLREKLDETDLRDNVIVILVTPGGLADVAYRIARLLQARYESVTICVPGWCKSAGTLLAMGGHNLIIGPRGELGPLDVQITKRDELFDRDSGLISNASLDRLREESFQFFESFMLQIIARSENAITFRTAADVAAEVTTGLMSPVFEKIDPLRLGADARAMQIGYAYAVRLNAEADNLAGAEALNMLLNGYPSHSFVIDYEEANVLFKRVQPLTGYLHSVVDKLGDLAIIPKDEPLLILFHEDESNAENDSVTKREAGAEDAAKPTVVEEKLAPIVSTDLQGDAGSERQD